MFTLSKASYNWILYLDVDERLNCNLKNNLKDLIESRSKKGYVAFKVNRFELVAGKPALFRNIMRYQIRIYNRKFVEYRGIIH